MIRALQADLQVNQRNPLTITVLVVYRFGNWIAYELHIPVVRQALWILYRILDVLFVRVMCCAELDAHCQIGPGLRLPHGANGIVIHKKAVIGRNVTVYHQVTLGGRNAEDSYPPTLGNHVEIFTGARILGSVKVGDGATVGANAVVIQDIPAFCLAVGVPARVIKRGTTSTLQ